MNTTACRSAEQAQAQLDCIQSLSDRWDANPESDELQDELHCLALSQEVRSPWQLVGQKLEPAEYRIVLCAGGPHVEIRGDLDSAGDPETATLWHCDWGQEPAIVDTTDPEDELMLWFAQTLYWGN